MRMHEYEERDKNILQCACNIRIKITPESNFVWQVSPITSTTKLNWPSFLCRLGPGLPDGCRQLGQLRLRLPPTRPLP